MKLKGAGALILGTLLAPAAADAATFEVNTLADTDDDTCATAPDDCSLRSAVEAANDANTDDLVTFAPNVTGVITLDPSEGPILIRNESLEIRGPGADVLTVDGGNATQIFKLFGFDTAGENVLISGLTMTNGFVEGTGGGAISSDSEGIDFDDGFELDVGEVANLTVAGSVVSNSTVDPGDGGGIWAGAFGGGPGAGGVALVNTTLSGNSAPNGSGGGLAVYEPRADITTSNTTFSGNSAANTGGAIYVLGNEPDEPPSRGVIPFGDVTVANTTVTDSTSNPQGGGAVAATNGPIALSSTIVANSVSGADLMSMGDASVFTAGFSLIEDPGTAQLTASPAGSNKNGVDPQLGALANNGGTTQTHLPALGSPALDSGVANATTPDQRGQARPFDDPEIANATGSDGSDIGAVELFRDIPPEIVERCFKVVYHVQRGTESGETIAGTADRDGTFAAGGDDIVTGLEGGDCLIGSRGNDRVSGEVGDDLVFGDPGKDEVYGDAGNDDVRGQGGNDKVYGGDGDDRIRGGAGEDVIKPGAGKDTVKGGRDPDLVKAADGEKDVINCGGGGGDVAIVDRDDKVSKCDTVRRR
jgi:CSLREA domain-containing protein